MTEKFYKDLYTSCEKEVHGKFNYMIVISIPTRKIVLYNIVNGVIKYEMSGHIERYMNRHESHNIFIKNCNFCYYLYEEIDDNDAYNWGIDPIKRYKPYTKYDQSYCIHIE